MICKTIYALRLKRPELDDTQRIYYYLALYFATERERRDWLKRSNFMLPWNPKLRQYYSPRELLELGRAGEVLEFIKTCLDWL